MRKCDVSHHLVVIIIIVFDHEAFAGIITLSQDLTNRSTYLVYVPGSEKTTKKSTTVVNFLWPIKKNYFSKILHPRSGYTVYTLHWSWIIHTRDPHLKWQSVGCRATVRFAAIVWNTNEMLANCTLTFLWRHKAISAVKQWNL